uniref:Dedicator of cytokinesis 4b n=1 Tax=Cyprinus carpio TaxID=7962 RepID=A0A8C1QTX1_CYPCA
IWQPFPYELKLSFRGTVQHGLPLEIGDTVQILEKWEGVSDICFTVCRPHLTHRQFEMVVPTEDSVITEMTSTLRDWGAMWKQLFVKNEGDLFHRLWHVMNEILDLRRQVLVGHLTHDRMRDVKQHITARLDWGNEQLGLDLVPRREFSMVDPDEISITELYRLVRLFCCLTTTTSFLSRSSQKDFSPSPIYISLALSLSLFCSERFFVKLSKNGLPKFPEKTERQCTLFVVSVEMKSQPDLSVMSADRFLCYRRPFGCAVVSIADLLTADSKDDHLLKVYACNTESDWSQIHDNIIKKVNSRYNLSGLAVALQLLHGDIEQLRREYMVLFTRGVSITKKLGFSDVIMPGENYFGFKIYIFFCSYTHPVKSLGSGYQSKFLKVVPFICILLLRTFKWLLIYSVCVCSPAKDKGEKKLFGFSFVPLMQEDGRTLPDGTHELIVHKVQLSKCLVGFSATNESLWITSFLCSTKLTQNGNVCLFVQDMIGHNSNILNQFLQDTLDTLFGILDESSKRYALKVFDCLVHIINLLQDSKFQHFKPVMDTYIESHFAGALSYRDLIKVLKWYVDRIIEADRQEHIQQVLKATEYIFKYIIQSRRLFALATGGQNEEEFRCCMHELFMSIRFFLSQENKGSRPITQTQAVFLQSFPAVYGELLKLFTLREVATFIRETLGSLPTASQADCPLEAAVCSMFAHMQEQRDLVMCAHILTCMMSLLKKDDTEPAASEEVDLIVQSVLSVLLRTILEIANRPQPAGPTLRPQGEFVSCLLALLRHMKDRHYQQLLQSFTSKDELRDFLLHIFTVFRILIRPEMFPKDWTVMRLVTNNIIITTVLYLSDALRKDFLNDKFDYKVWDSYFCLSVIFINQPCLQLETFSASKRKKILEKYGDMRVMMGCEIFSMWQNLGEHKLNFIPAMIGPFLEVTLVPQPDLRNVMIPIFHDMMDWEQRRSGNFKQVEAKLIDKLDSLMSEGKGDETYRELFNSIIPLFGPYPSLLKKIERETWRESGISLIATVTRLMERLLDYRDCMKLGEVDGKKIGCTVSLLNFYKTELNKEEMYIRYIHKLYDLHLKAQNYTEASYTLLLYDELLEWSERPLREFLSYPMQSEWQRKEYLHLTIIQNFDRGKCWENGILLCRELADQYESYYDYRNLSKMRMMEASFYDKIMDQQRLEPEFFRVGFYGKKFPFFLRNKEFVCRGHDYERLEAFQQRMLNEFPHAIAMQHANQPDQTIYQAEAQYLQIYAVTPIPDSQDVLQRDGVPDNIKSFYKVNHIWRYRYDRPFHKGTKDKENEFKSLWVERTTLTLVQSLPGISRWFEVERKELVEVSPLENAIEVIENKNMQLRTLITQCQTGQMQNINPLTMCLNGVIDAAVNGGLARYQEAFFVKDYIMNHPEDGDKIGRLRELMFEQAQILEFGLTVHEKFVPQDMRPLHKKLVDQFHLMKSSLGIQVHISSQILSDFPSCSSFGRNSAPNIMSPEGGARVVSRRRWLVLKSREQDSS